MHGARRRWLANDEWSRVQPFHGVDIARARYLTPAECKRLLNACEGDFRTLVHAGNYVAHNVLCSIAAGFVAAGSPMPPHLREYTVAELEWQTVGRLQTPARPTPLR